jgi:hypothetical protein
MAAASLEKGWCSFFILVQDVLPGSSQCLRLKANNNKLTTSLPSLIFFFHFLFSSGYFFLFCRENRVQGNLSTTAVAEMQTRLPFEKQKFFFFFFSQTQVFRLGHAVVLIRGERIITPA